MPSKLTSLKPKVAALDIRTCSTPVVERIRGHELTKIRERIAIRDDYSCRQCGRVTVHGEVDHKVPLHLGGAESDENRQWLCPECHARKSEREERERGK